MIYGNLTRDPELKALPNGTPVASLSVATNRVYKDRDGAKQEDTDFHNVVVFGRQAETVSQFLKKGSPAYVEGRIQTRSWEKDGVKQYRTEIIAEIVQFGPKVAPSSTDIPPAITPTDGVDDVIEAAAFNAEATGDEINPDEIPF